MKLKKTEHSYYCSDNNYYVGNHNGENFGRAEFENWKEFKEEWLGGADIIDHDFNHCFRFDIHNKYNEETEEEIEDKYYLELFFVLQRKGIFRPVIIHEIIKEDIPEIENYLKSCWEYLKKQWSEINEVEDVKENNN